VPIGHHLVDEWIVQLAAAPRDGVDDVIMRTLAALSAFTEAQRAYVTIYHEDGTFQNSHEWTADDVVPQLPVIHGLSSTDYPASYGAAVADRIFAAPDLDALGDEADAERRSFGSFGVRAVLQVPISIDDDMIGLIGFNYWDPVDGWDPVLIQAVRRVGAVIGAVLARRRADADIDRLLEDARRATSVKDVLLAELSHELRNPLHVILGHAELLEVDRLDPADREALFQIRTQGQHLLTMIDDLLSLTDGTAEGRRVEVWPVLESIVDRLAPVCERRSISLGLDVASPAVIRTEIGRLRQVTYCVVSGGVQAIGTRGSIRLGVEQTSPDDAATVAVSLSAQGELEPDNVVSAMAMALVDGHGAIEVESVEGNRVDVTVRFDGRRRDAPDRLA
jgi:signal transduction histidine kinase